MSKLKWVLRKAKGRSSGCSDKRAAVGVRTRIHNCHGCCSEPLPGKVYVTSRVPHSHLQKSTLALHRFAWTYHHEELTSGVSQVKSRGSQSQIPPRGTFILTPLRPHQVRLRVRAPCVPRAEALSAGSASSRLPAPRRAPAPRSRLRREARLADKVSEDEPRER